MRTRSLFFALVIAGAWELGMGCTPPAAEDAGSKDAGGTDAFVATDAARADTATAPDTTVAPDSTIAEDASVTPDATSAEDATVNPDATVTPDATVNPDATVGVDSAVADAATEDATPASDAGVDPCVALNCTDHQICNAAQGRCDCNADWSGASCDQRVALVIVGDYFDDWDMEHTVTAELWSDLGGGLYADALFHISQYSNAGQFLIAQNDAANYWDPSAWARFDWTVTSDGDLYYCQTVSDAASEADALATARADDSDPANGGCGSFSWTLLYQALAIRGDYVDNWGFDHAVTQTDWATMGALFHIRAYSNVDQFIIALNDSANSWGADLWSRFDWTVTGAGALYYCQIVANADTQDDAAAVTTANPADLETGCGGFSWSRLDEPLAIRGEFVDDWGWDHRVTQTLWTDVGRGEVSNSLFHITQFSNAGQYLIAMNDTGNTYNAGLWSRFDWLVTSDSVLHYCQTIASAATEVQAMAATRDSNLETGCGGWPWSMLNVALPIRGTYADWYDNDHVISQSQWAINDQLFSINAYDNTAMFLVAQNGAVNTVAPNGWSRFDWTVDETGGLWFCQSAWDAATFDDALAASADHSDLIWGCNGDSWSMLEEPIAIRGTYIDDYTYVHQVTQADWIDVGQGTSDSVFHITLFNNVEQFLVARNDAANPFGNGGLWSRFDWAYSSSAALHYCQITFDAPSEDAAFASATAVHTDLAAGCNGFPWSLLSPVP